MPDLKDPVTVQPVRNKDWDYETPSAISIFNKNKKAGSYGFKTCQDMAKAIVANIDTDNDAIEKVDFSQMGKGDPAKSGFFLNITLKNSFI